jgi:hypothetical protein
MWDEFFYRTQHFRCAECGFTRAQGRTYPSNLQIFKSSNLQIPQELSFLFKTPQPPVHFFPKTFRQKT